MVSKQRMEETLPFVLTILHSPIRSRRQDCASLNKVLLIQASPAWVVISITMTVKAELGTVGFLR